ncbi:MAG: response regulator [Verrucomicrobiota bacterium]|jgi:CheY-like chemotaxis protein
MGVHDFPRRHILVIDDEQIVREVLRRMLQNDGYAVTTASSGEEALAVFEPGKFGLVLTDFCMPGMNGDALAAAIKNMAPTQPVVMLTAYAADLCSAECLSGNVDLLLGKPFGIAELRQAIAALLAQPEPPTLPVEQADGPPRTDERWGMTRA